MNYRDTQVVVSSTIRAINKARILGKMVLKPLHLFSVIDYYIQYTQDVINTGNDSYKLTNTVLKEYKRNLAASHTDTICNYKITSNTTNSTRTIIPNSINIAPTASNNTINIGTSTTYTFRLIDLIVNFRDPNNDTYKDIRIFTTGLSGKLLYNDIQITSSSIIIPVGDISKLKYERANNNVFTDTLNVMIGDSHPNQLFTPQITITINGTASIVNQAPILGDNTIYVDNNVTTILTLSMFTTQLSPPYSDPEGDLIDAIRIDSIAGSNLGLFYLNNIQVMPGLVITREQIAANLFTHVGPNIDNISSDYFTFSARDEGSLIWVN